MDDILIIVDNEPPPPYSLYDNEGYEHDSSSLVVNLPPTSIQDPDSSQQDVYSLQDQRGYPPHGQPGYPPQGQPEYPCQGRPPGSHPQCPPGYPQPECQLGCPSHGVLESSPRGQPEYPPQGQPEYTPQGQPEYTVRGQPRYPSRPQDQPEYPLQLRYPAVSSQPTMASETIQYHLGNSETDGQGPFIETVDPSGNCVLAWVACLLCFWPIGICAVISSHKARDALNKGEAATAVHYSVQSSKLSWVAIGVGFIFYGVAAISVMVWMTNYNYF